jgi:hypothetical protein
MEAVMSLDQIVGRFVVEAEEQRLEAYRRGNPSAIEAAEDTCHEVYRAVRQIVQAAKGRAS